MASEWTRVKIGDISDRVTKGTTPTTVGGSYSSGEINFVKAESISDDGSFLKDKLSSIDQVTNQILSRSVLNEDDLLFTIAGTIGRSAIVTKDILPANTNQAVAIITPKKSLVEPKYLRYVLKTNIAQEYARSRVVQAVQANFSLGELKALEIPLPPLPIQRQIAAILSAFDDKIELNRQMNRTLEQMARALFKSWFVDFDAVRAKMRGEQPEGMGAATAALFPSELVEVDGREVPKGWEIKGLDEIADFLNGLALQKFPPTGENDLPVIKIAQLRKGNTEGSGFAARTVGEKYIVKDGDILFSWSGSLEVVRWSGGEGALNQHLFKVTSSEYPSWFIFWWLLEYLPEFQAIAANKATTMGHIQRKHLNDAKAVLPPKDLLLRLGESLYPLFESMFQNDQESARLAQLRDALLPMLLSGEVDVSEWAAPQEEI